MVQICVTFGVDLSISACGTNGSVWQKQRVVSLFMYISVCGSSSSVWYRRRVVSHVLCTFQHAVVAALHTLELAFIYVSFIRRCLFIDLNQTRVGDQYDHKTNIRW